MPSVFTDGITILYCSSPPPATTTGETAMFLLFSLRGED